MKTTNRFDRPEKPKPGRPKTEQSADERRKHVMATILRQAKVPTKKIAAMFEVDPRTLRNWYAAAPDYPEWAVLPALRMPGRLAAAS